MAINATTGEITGTFTALYPTGDATITASNGISPDDSITIEFTVGAALAAPLITTRTFPAQSYRIGDVFTPIDVNATGNPAPTWSSTDLPAGLAIDGTTGEITGTFTALYPTATATITASNGVSPDDTITISFTVLAALAAPQISPRTVDAQVYPINVAITPFTELSVTGNPASTWSATGLPTGLEINATTGAITGTPTAAQLATDATITASNGVGSDDSITISFAVVVLVAPLFVPSTQPSVTGNVAASFTLDLNATGDPAPTYSAANLPSGLGIDATTGVISGTFTTQQTRTTTITASNGVNPPATVDIQFTVLAALAAPQITTTITATQSLNTNVPYSLQLAATGFPTDIMWSITSGTLPNNVTLNPATGEISGTPDTDQTSRTVVITATNGVNPDDTISIAFEVTTVVPLAFGSIASQVLTINTPYSFTIPVTGLPTPIVTEEFQFSGAATPVAGNIILSAGIWRGGTRIGNRIHFVRDTTNVTTAYDFNGDRQSSDDITLTGASSIRGIVSTDDRIYVFALNGTSALAFNHSGDRVSDDDIDLSVVGTGNRWEGATATDSLIYFVDNIDDVARAFNLDGTRSDTNDIPLTSGAWRSALALRDRIYFLNDGSVEEAWGWDLEGNRQTDFDLSFVPGFWHASAASDNRMWFVDNSTDIAASYFTYVSALPPGVTYANGVVSGTATQVADAVGITFTAENSQGAVSTTISFEVLAAASAPNITTLFPAQNLTIGDAVSLQLRADANPAETWAVTAGTLPGGITLDEITGLISGTTNALYPQQTITVTASNDLGADTTNIQFTVSGTSPTLSAVAAQSYIQNRAITPVTLQASGNPTPTITELRSVPQGQANDFALANGAWRGAARNGNRIYFVRTGSTTLFAYDLQGGRQSGDDIAITGTSYEGIVFTDSRIFLVDNGASIAKAFSHNGTAVNEDIDLGVGGWNGATRKGDRLYFLDNANNVIRVYTALGTRRQTEDITIQNRAYRSVLALDDAIYVIASSTNNAYPYYYNGTAFDDAFRVSLGDGNWQGSVWTPNHEIFFVDADGNMAHAFSDGSNLPQGIEINDGTLSGTPTAVFPTTTATFQAKNNVLPDASITVPFTVAAALFAPTIPTDALASYQLYRTVPFTLNLNTLGATANPALTWAHTGGTLPPGLNFTGTTLSGTPSTEGVYQPIFTASNSEGNTPITITFTVSPPLTIPVITTTPFVRTLRVGQSITGIALSATGNPTPEWSASNLPPGLSFSSLTGHNVAITGTPTEEQDAQVATITASNSQGSDTLSVNFTVLAAFTLPVISSDALTSYSFVTGSGIDDIVIRVTGNPLPQWSILSGALPTGLELVTGDTLSVTIRGEPTEAGTFVVTLRALNSEGNDTITLTFTVSLALAAPQITTRTFPAQSYRIGDVFTPIDVNATGNPAPTWSAANLPAGLVIDAATGEITGTFTALYSTGVATIMASNGINPDDSITIEFTVTATLASPVFTPTTQPAVSALVGDAFNLDINATGNPTPTYSATNLPSGIGINATTGVISGTFTTVQTRTATITASNGVSPDDTITITFNVSAALVAPQISPRSAPLRIYFVGVGITPLTPFSVTGNPTPTWSATGLPAGLGINATTGEISGTPTSQQTLSFATITATNSVSSDSVMIELAVSTPLAPQFIPPTQTSFTRSVGDSFTLDLGAFGNPSPHYLASNLPDGLNIESGTGIISGTFTTVQTRTATITARSSYGPDDTITLTFTIT